MIWRTVSLGEVANVGAGNSAPQEHHLFENGIYNFYRTSDVGRIRTGIISESSDKLNSEGIKGLKLHPVGTILFPKSGASTFLNHRVMLGKEGFVSSHLATIKAKADVADDKYLLYFLSTIDAKNLVQDSSYPSLKTSVIEKIVFLLPTLPIQQKIVEKLDRIFAEIDKAVAAADANAKNVEALFQSQLGEIIAGEDDWSLYTLREVCDIARGGSPRPIDKFITELEDGINWVKISDATRSKKYIYETRQKIKKEGISRSRFVNDGDFLLSNSMSFGRPYIMRTTGCIHDGWLVLSKYQKHLDIDFFYYLLSSSVIVGQFENLAKGSTVRNLNIELVSRVRIKIPSIQKQKMIVTKLNQISNEIDNLKKFYQKKEIQLKLLKQSILKKAFNGELVKAA